MVQSFYQLGLKKPVWEQRNDDSTNWFDTSSDWCGSGKSIHICIRFKGCLNITSRIDLDHDQVIILFMSLHYIEWTVGIFNISLDPRTSHPLTFTYRAVVIIKVPLVNFYVIFEYINCLIHEKSHQIIIGLLL